PPVPPSRLHPGLPADLEAICLRCLRKRPGRRYRTALELADDLRRFQEGRRVQFWPVGMARRAGRWCLHNPAAATACLALSTALALTAYRYRQVVHGREQ